MREQDEGLFRAGPIYGFDRHAGQRVLDIGCGNGWPVENFARGGAEITGLDLTEAAVRLTRRRLALAGLSATLVVGNAEQLPFPRGGGGGGNGTFDPRLLLGRPAPHARNGARDGRKRCASSGPAEPE